MVKAVCGDATTRVGIGERQSGAFGVGMHRGLVLGPLLFVWVLWGGGGITLCGWSCSDCRGRGIIAGEGEEMGRSESECWSDGGCVVSGTWAGSGWGSVGHPCGSAKETVATWSCA